VRAGWLRVVGAGPVAGFVEAKPLIVAFARRGVAFVG
jgi:hypothetical protein